MRKGGSKRKGSAFERAVCKALSLWWSNNKTDEIFWRTSGSGGRATRRRKKGKKTFGQYGDIQAVDPQGQPLIDMAVFELKHGYKRQGLQGALDLIGRKPGTKPCLLTEFINQARAESLARDESRNHWILIVKPHYKDTLVLVPMLLWKRLPVYWAADRPESGNMIWRNPKSQQRIVITTLEWFMRHISARKLRYQLTMEKQDEKEG